MTAYITGTSTRKVDDSVKALGCDSGVSKSTVSRICVGIDADVNVLRTRRLDHQPFVYVWLDATYVHVREMRHVTSKAVVIATGLRADGHREVLGVDVGDSENETFWREFLTDLVDRGEPGHPGPPETPAQRQFDAVAADDETLLTLPSKLAVRVRFPSPAPRTPSSAANSIATKVRPEFMPRSSHSRSTKALSSSRLTEPAAVGPDVV